MRHPIITHCLALLTAVAAMPALAGTVEVRYDPKANYSDAGATPQERVHHLDALAAYLRGLGERGLAPGRLLKVELIDVDLAGEQPPSKRAQGAPRVLTGRGDGPRIELRFTLTEGGKELASGRETLSDIRLPRLDTARDANSPVELHQEKLLLDHWFAERIAKLP